MGASSACRGRLVPLGGGGCQQQEVVIAVVVGGRRSVVEAVLASSTVHITISNRWTSNRVGGCCRGCPGFGEITASIITGGRAARVRRRGGGWTCACAASVLGGRGRGWRPPRGRRGGRGRRRVVQS